MIRLTDTALLAFTKLRARKIRTIITVLLASLLFGVLVTVSLVATGAFQSLDAFRADGLTSRYIVGVTPPYTGDSARDARSDPALIAEAKKRYEEIVAEKTAEAKRLGLFYTQAADLPPYTESLDGRTAMLSIRDANSIAQAVLAEHFRNQAVLDDTKLEATAKQYNALKMFYSMHYTVRSGSTLEAYQDGKEIFYDKSDEVETNTSYRHSLVDGNNMVLSPSDIAAPFMLPDNAGWRPDDASLPIILPQNNVEQLLGLSALPDTASAQEKLDHLTKVREGATELVFKACYRNDASNSLIQRTIAVEKETKAHAGDKEYLKPAVIYELPDPTTCENPQVVVDTRTAQEKQHDENQRVFDEKFYGSTQPISYFVTFKVVGISPAQPFITSDMIEKQSESLGDIVNELLTTSGVGQVIPLELYEQLPDKDRHAELFTYTPLFVFGNEDNKQRFIEFATAEDAQNFIDEQGCTTQVDSTCKPEGRLYQARLTFSNSAAIEDIRVKTVQWSVYAMFGVVVMAAAIMWITIGRTIADGRRETAVFRAIGFKRIDIASVYVLYTVILSMLVVVFAIGIGVVAAYFVDRSFADGLTAQAQYSFGGLDMSKKVSLMGFDWQQLGLILLACFVTGMLSMIVPLLRNVRRSPIRDIREE
jgi:hypothetical protein